MPRCGTGDLKPPGEPKGRAAGQGE